MPPICYGPRLVRTAEAAGVTEPFRRPPLAVGIPTRPARGRAGRLLSGVFPLRAGVLFCVYLFNFIDRQILSILIDPIKAELGASDTQMGFLTGLAFAIFYTGFGIPIARWADRGVRRSIIAVGLTVWSVMTALCGLAQSFVHLALARTGVGIGEAGAVATFLR